MNTNQKTLANAHRTRLADQADVARLTAVPPRLPLHPLSSENAYGDPRLLHDVAVPGAEFARRLGVDVVVGAETGGIPLDTTVAPITKSLPIESVATYVEVLAAAADHGVLDPATHRLGVDALVNHWPDNDPRWALLDHAA